MKFSIVAAADLKNGIGLKGSIPWKLKEDIEYFRKLTTETENPNNCNAVIMGRKTWESIPKKFRPLPNRYNIVLSRKKVVGDFPGARHMSSLETALEAVNTLNFENCFIIGGGEIYKEAVLHPDCEKIYLSQIMDDFDCDTFFPPIDGSFEKFDSSIDLADNGLQYSLVIYKKRPFN